MSVRLDGGFFPPLGVALPLALHAVGDPRLSRHNSLTAAGDHLPPLYHLDVRAGLYPRHRVNRLGWLRVTVGILLDISSYAGSSYSNRNRLPGYNGT